MNFGILGQHADDKVISNIRERIQKQQKLRSMQSMNNFKSGQGNANTSKLLANNENAIHVKKTAHQALANKNRQVLTEISNSNSRPLRSNSYRSLKNKKATDSEENKPLENTQNKQEIYQESPSKSHLEASDIDMDSNNGSNNSVIHQEPQQRVLSNSSNRSTSSTTSTFVNALKPEYTENDIQTIKRINARFRKFEMSSSDPDRYDPMYAPEYTNEIMNHIETLSNKYLPRENLISYQKNISWGNRRTVLSWLIRSHETLNFLPETLYLTVNIFDRMLSSVEISKEKLYLVCAASFFIATKYEEINCLTIADLLKILNHEYEAEEIYLAEGFILQTLNFDFGNPGPMTYLRRLSKADMYERKPRSLAKYLIETTIMDPKLVAAPSRWIAAGCYYLSLIILENLTDYARAQSNNGEHLENEKDENFSIWKEEHIYFSGFCEGQLNILASTIAQNCRNWRKTHPTIYEKYKTKSNMYSSILVDKWFEILQENQD